MTLPTAGAAPIEALVPSMDFLLLLSVLLLVVQGVLVAVFGTIGVFALQQGDTLSGVLSLLVSILILLPPRHDPAVIWKAHQEGWRR